MNRTKKTILTFLLLSLSISSFAQFGVPNLLKYDKQTFHFGFMLGFGQYDYSISSKPDLSEYDSLMMINTQSRSGFSLGIVTNLRLGKYFDLRFIPGLSFPSRHVNYTYRIPSSSNVVHTTHIEAESVCLDLPLLIKFKSSRMLNNLRAYVIAGGQYSFDMISAKKKKNSGSAVNLKLNPHDVQAQVGVGLDFYCTYFKFSTELKMSFGFFDMLVHENDDQEHPNYRPNEHMYVNSVNRLCAKNILISFVFE